MPDINIKIKNAEAATDLYVEIFDPSMPVSSDARHMIELRAQQTSQWLPIGIANGVSAIRWTAQDLAEVREPGFGEYNPVADAGTYDVKAA